MRKGATTSSNASGAMERMVCSNSKVKSNPPRQSPACGPKVLSTWAQDGVDDAAIVASSPSFWSVVFSTVSDRLQIWGERKAATQQESIAQNILRGISCPNRRDVFGRQN